ncbi:MAG: metallophosphoesterase family protein [Spirulina sp.]
MRLFAVGDIHGCATALNTLLAAIDPRPGDCVVTLGDYVNKGPDSKAVLDSLVRLSREGILVPLLGNHEIKFLIARRLGRAIVNGEVLVDQQTLTSYGAADGGTDHLSVGGNPNVRDDPAVDSPLTHVPDSHWHLLQHQGLRWFATEKYIFLHGTLSPHRPLLQQPDQAIFWDKLQRPQPHPSGKILICGHTPQRSGHPLNLGHTICLDTAACEGHWLTCLEVNSGTLWQANQAGHLRQSHLQDYGPFPLTFPRPPVRAEGQPQLPTGPVPAWPTAPVPALVEARPSPSVSRVSI